MTWRRYSLLLVLGPLVTACDKIPFLGGNDDADSVAVAAADTAPAAARPAAREAPPPAPVRRVAATPAGALVDEPWTPVDTGTLRPGMSRDDVVTTWGEPVAERQMGARAYLYFRNGCEVTCGTFDVVFLEDGQVVDVIARGAGHAYAGASSSPGDREPAPTPTGDLRLPPPDTTRADTTGTATS
jgi:hypothetical protein